MTEEDIAKALGKHLLLLSGIPSVVWENKDDPVEPARPYLALQVVRVSRRSLDLNGGGGIISRGYFQITIVGELDVYATASLILADSIAAHFKKSTRLTEASGELKIQEAPRILTGFRDGPDWRTPIQADYWAG